MQLQLYLHFPFCKWKCSYCDFVSFVAPKEAMKEYGALLEKEIRIRSAQYGRADIVSVFLGGGTPSVMPMRAMEGVLSALHACFHISRETEFSVEANPGTITDEWLALMREHGMNRLSLGVQASQDRLLEELGRIHRIKDTRDSVFMARKRGVKNLNLDVMFGLPGQGIKDYQETLDMVRALRPEHVSAYGLVMEAETPLSRKVEQGLCCLPADDAVADMAELGTARLAEYGYERYEISNYAMPGYRCKHNVGYWQGTWYMGIGLAAHSMLPCGDGTAAYLRVENTEDWKTYRLAIESNEPPVRRMDVVRGKEAMFETMMLGLRTVMGVNEKAFLQRHGIGVSLVYGEVLARLVGEGLGQWIDDLNNGRSFALTGKGLQLQNAVLLQFMP